MERIVEGVDPLLDSTLSVRLELPAAAAAAPKLPPLPEEFLAFAFKVMDLRAAGGRLAAFLITFDLGFAFVAMSLRNCKWIPLKSQGAVPLPSGTAVARI